METNPNMNLIRKIYHKYINLDQWFIYGSARISFVWYFLSLISNVSIIIMFMKLPQNPLSPIIFAFAVCIGVVILGFFLFRMKAQRTDILMQMWRNPEYTLMTSAVYLAHPEMYQILGVPIPPELAEWGFTDWEDMKRFARYMLAKGKEAYAMPICQEFFKRTKK